MRINLIKERKKKHLTQIQIANNLKISERHYKSLEAGTSKGSMKIWENLKQFFHKSIDYLYQDTDLKGR